jgi:hypothetical protein
MFLVKLFTDLNRSHRETLQKGRLSTVDFHIMVACFVKQYTMFAISKAADQIR